MEKMKKDFFEGMTLEEIKTAVKADNRGFHEVCYLKDSRVCDKGKSKIYMIGKMSYRFNLNYGKNKIVRLENSIHAASTKEEVEKCQRDLKSLSEAQRQCVSAKSLDVLRDKFCCISVGAPIKVTERRKIDRKHDDDVPNIVYCDNGNVTLTCYKSFQYDVSKRGYRKPFTRFYIQNYEDGSIAEINESDPRYKADIDKLKKDYVSSKASKRKSKPSLVYSHSCKDILSISVGKKKA